MKKITRKLIKECYLEGYEPTRFFRGVPDLEKLVKSVAEECANVASDGGSTGIVPSRDIVISSNIKKHFGIQ